NAARVLSKNAGIESYYNFVGWLPLLFAVAAFRLVPSRLWRLLAFFLIAILMVFFVSSAIPLRFLRDITPTLVTLRQPSIVAFYATPFIIGLASWGVDELLKLGWPRIMLAISESTASVRFSTKVCVFLLLVWSVRAAYDANQPSLRVDAIPRDDMARARQSTHQRPSGYRSRAVIPLGQSLRLIMA